MSEKAEYVEPQTIPIVSKFPVSKIISMVMVNNVPDARNNGRFHYRINLNGAEKILSVGGDIHKELCKVPNGSAFKIERNVETKTVMVLVPKEIKETTYRVIED